MNGWETKTLGVCRKITGGVHHTPKYIETGIPFLSVKNLTQGVIDSNTKFISSEDRKVRIKQCKPEMQDVLYTKVGKTGYRIFHPENDGLTKVDHVKNMLQGLVHQKLLPFDTVEHEYMVCR